MNVEALKTKAREFEQQGLIDQALATYRQLIAHLEDTAEIDRELPLYVKAGDLFLKLGDAKSAVALYGRAAKRYAQAGGTRGVVSLCHKIVRAAPTRMVVYPRLARLMLDGGHVGGAREVLVHYAKQTKQTGGLQVLERLEGRAAHQAKPVLEKLLAAADRREEAVLERRPPERAAQPQPPREPRAPEPPSEPEPRREPATRAELLGDLPLIQGADFEVRDEPEDTPAEEPEFEIGTPEPESKPQPEPEPEIEIRLAQELEPSASRAPEPGIQIPEEPVTEEIAEEPESAPEIAAEPEPAPEMPSAAVPEPEPPIQADIPPEYRTGVPSDVEVEAPDVEPAEVPPQPVATPAPFEPPTPAPPVAPSMEAPARPGSRPRFEPPRRSSVPTAARRPLAAPAARTGVGIQWVAAAGVIGLVLGIALSALGIIPGIGGGEGSGTAGSDGTSPPSGPVDETSAATPVAAADSAESDTLADMAGGGAAAAPAAAAEGTDTAQPPTRPAGPDPEAVPDTPPTGVQPAPRPGPQAADTTAAAPQPAAPPPVAPATGPSIIAVNGLAVDSVVPEPSDPDGYRVYQSSDTGERLVLSVVPFTGDTSEVSDVRVSALPGDSAMGSIRYRGFLVNARGSASASALGAYLRRLAERRSN